MLFIAALLGLPLFMEVGVVLLIPIVMMAASRAQQPLLRLGIPMLAGLSILHGLVPPHPGPVAAGTVLGGDLGVVLLINLPIAVLALAAVFDQFPGGTSMTSASTSGPVSVSRRE